MTLSRRKFQAALAIIAAGGLRLNPAYSQAAFGNPEAPVNVEQWVEDARITKASDSALKLQRFVEPIYILLEDIVWEPNNDQAGFPRVIVPKGFVTDLASIPQAFWSILPRDGEYAYAAIVHDYLYWDQNIPKPQADQILKMSMEDLEVSKATVAVIYNAVKQFGDGAWHGNNKLKQSGERRLLKRFPTGKSKWADWKLLSDVFA